MIAPQKVWEEIQAGLDEYGKQLEKSIIEHVTDYEKSQPPDQPK